jgi:3-dehydroquinate synthase
MMEQILVNLKEKSYSICIGQGIFKDIGRLLSKNGLTGRCAIITNPTINKLYGNLIKENLVSNGFEAVVFEVPDSETSKSLKQVELLNIELLNNKFDRDSIIIALGGGVIGDLAGFVAATYMRGVSLVQVPTTLLALVDSAIGGKVAVDLSQGKNLVGVFYQPKLVISDIETLKTLPEEEIQSGLAEVIKYGIVSDRDLFELLENNITKIKQCDLELFTKMIIKCSKIKAKVVEEDEKEQGKRIILNLGHTLGHALEAITEYNTFTHGEAVSIGMLYAANLSTRFDLLDEKDHQRIVALIRSVGLPTNVNENLAVDKILKTMQFDKKNRDGKNVFVLPKKIGEAVITDKIPNDLLKAELEGMLK